MKWAWRVLIRLVKWSVLVAVLVEVISLITITASNYLIYGSVYEGSRARYDAHTLFLEKDGRRETTFNKTADDPSRNRVIWMFGGSTLRGSTDDDRKTLPSIVARELNRTATDGLAYTVINFGVNSFNCLLELKYLQKALIEEKRPPDLIVFYDGANDCTYFPQYRTPYGHHGYRRVRALVESYRNQRLGLLKPVNAAVSASFTKELYDKVTALTDLIQPDAPLLSEYVDLTEKRYEHVNKLADAYGARFVAFWQPLLWVETDEVGRTVQEQEKHAAMNPSRFATLKGNITIVYDGIEKNLRGKPYFVEFRNILCGRMQIVYRADGVHLEDAGREMVGMAVAQALRERFVRVGAERFAAREGRSP